MTDAQGVLLLCVQAARNKTFDVCYEAQTEAGNEMYELVSTLLQLQRAHVGQLMQLTAGSWADCDAGQVAHPGNQAEACAT